MSKVYALALREHPPLALSNPFAGLDLPMIELRPIEFYERHEAETLERPSRTSSSGRSCSSECRPATGRVVPQPRRLARRLVHVTHVMTRYGLREHPKSRKSHRTVPVPPDILHAMASFLRDR